MCKSNNSLLKESKDVIDEEIELIMNDNGNDENNGEYDSIPLNYCSCLLTVEELPPWHFQHRGIRFGYRKSPSSFVNALYSAFQWHNESINIWSHYITAIALVIYLIYLTDYGDNLTGSSLDNTILVGNITLSNIFPMIASAMCHQFYYINKNAHEFCWFFDFTGILLGMFLGGSSFMYFAFYCDNNSAYVSVIFLGTIFVYVYKLCWQQYSSRVQKDILFPKDRFPEFSKNLSNYAILSSILPLALATSLKKEYLLDSEFRNILLHTLLSPVMSTIGIIVFAQGGMPERYCKFFKVKENTFDFIGHSHQIWHLVASAAMFNWIYALVLHYNARTSRSCHSI